MNGSANKIQISQHKIIISLNEKCDLNFQMSNDPFTVPVLSLTNSRSRKSIPTKDAFMSRNQSFDSRNPIISSNPYLQKRQDPRNGYHIETRTNTNFMNLPPRPKATQFPPSIPRKQVKEISRNVYLSSQDENSAHTNMHFGLGRQDQELSTHSNIGVDKARGNIVRSSSRGSLFKNPQSRIEIQNQVMKQTSNMEFKKLDINKALFERKMSKIMQQIEFYDEELNGLYKDSLEDELEELEKMKNQNKQVHSKILQDLNRLIA